MANIKVAIKVRPLIDREKKAGENVCWKVKGNNITQIDPSTGIALRGGYTFDHVFDMDASNDEIFDKVVKPLVCPTVDGFNTTIFAYGQTSSGKTYTMLGSKDEPGIIPLTVSAMFDAMQRSSGREFLVRASYMEIYNERINDLLDKKYNLKIREEDGKAVVPELKEEVVTTTEKILLLMRRGQKNRHIGETNMNERSSRSHTIFRLVVESREAKGSQGDCNEDDIIKVSHLNMVDLAGSERSDQTGNKFGSDRFREGCHINLSLFKLSQVISQLSDGKKHISFRDSKLTRILEPALGGNALTAIICNVTPASIEETNCTLSFASRAKKIKNEPHVNEVLSHGTLLKRYACQITKLKEELEKAKSQNAVQEMETKLLEKELLNTELQERINRLSNQLIGACASQNVADSFHFGMARGPPLRRKTWAGAALGVQCFSQRMEPIPESPVPSVAKQTNTSTEDGIPFEEFERDLLESDESAATTTDVEEFFPSSFVNIRRGSKKCRGGWEVFDDNILDTDEKIDNTAGAASLDRAAGAASLERAAGAASLERAAGAASLERAAGAASLERAAGAASLERAAGAASLERAAGAASRDQAIQTEQPHNSNSQAVGNNNSTGALPIKETQNISCQTSLAANSSPDISSDSVEAETPPHIIRASLKELQKEFEELKEFTKLERQIYEEKPEMVSIAVQTTPCSTRDTKVRFAAQKEASGSYIGTDGQEQVLTDNKGSLIKHKEILKHKFDQQEEDSCVAKDTSSTNDCNQNLTLKENSLHGDIRSAEECSHSLMQLRIKLNELTTENTAQKSEINTMNSNNEKLRERMLTEIAALAQVDDEANTSDNMALFDKFVNSIIQKEQEVVRHIIEDSDNKLSAKENWISQLEKQIVSLEEELENSQKEKNKLHVKLMAQKDEFNILEQDRLQLNKKLTKSEADMSFLQDENKDLTSRLKAAEEKILKLTENEKYLLLNIEKEKEQRTLLENDLSQTKEKCEELKNNLECSLRTDEKLLLSEANTLREQIQTLKLENASLVDSIKMTQEECLKATAAATQNSECLKSIRKRLISLVSVFPDSSRIKCHSFEQILAFISQKLSQSCHKCPQLTCDLQKMKLELETLQENLAISLEKQKQLECTNVSGSRHLEGKDLHKLSSSVVHKTPFQNAGDNKKVSFHHGLDTEIESLHIKDTEVYNRSMVVSIGVNTVGGCRCEELEKENKQLIQESVARRCKIAQLQEEVANQANIIGLKNSELKEAEHKIRVYKMELKQVQRTDRTLSQVNQSRTCCDAANQTDDLRMFINYGCGIVTDTLVENLRMAVFDLKTKNDKLNILYRTQADKTKMLENKIMELKGEEKTYSNVRVQTDDKQKANFSSKEVQVDMFPLNASPHEIGQILFWKSRAERRLEEKNVQVKLCDKLMDEIKELKQKPEPLAIRNLAYTLRDDTILCIGRSKPTGKENVKHPYIDKP